MQIEFDYPRSQALPKRDGQKREGSTIKAMLLVMTWTLNKVSPESVTEFNLTCCALFIYIPIFFPSYLNRH